MPTYEEQFLDTCDAEGNAPEWAIYQIMNEHGSSQILMSEHYPEDKWNNGEAILEWLGH